MNEIERLQVELFQLVEAQTLLGQRHQQLEKAKNEKYEQLQKLRSEAAKVLVNVVPPQPEEEAK